MNIFKIKGITTVIFFVTTAFLAGCDNQEKFTIKGNISNAKGKMLYLSNVGIRQNVFIDSTKLDSDGSFSFSHTRPDSYDFFRLQLDKKGRQITIAIDSTETVTVTSDATNFADSCTITGSEESNKIKELITLESALQRQVDMLIKNSSPAIGETRETIYRIMNEFKQNICKEYIAAAPQKASAYYALFLRLNGQPLFDPMNNRFDSRCYSAVATNLNHMYPHAKRAMHLYNIAVKGMRLTQPVKRDTLYIDSSNSVTTGIFDIKLPNINGDSISLTSQKGKVVMLDFTVYGDARISARNLDLREIYDKYKEKGFEIYQISFDNNKHFWSTSAENLPWICVYDEYGFTSYNATLYRIDKVPTYFLINRANEVVLRDEQVKDLEKSIKELLNE